MASVVVLLPAGKVSAELNPADRTKLMIGVLAQIIELNGTVNRTETLNFPAINPTVVGDKSQAFANLIKTEVATYGHTVTHVVFVASGLVVAPTN